MYYFVSLTIINSYKKVFLRDKDVKQGKIIRKMIIVQRFKIFKGYHGSMK